MAPHRLRIALLLAAVTVAAVALFFRVQIGNGFTVLFGDFNDAIIGTTILEHWRAVFAGDAHWNRVSYFHPYADSLGYNDGLLLYGLAYTLFRWCGIDPFLSTELVSMVVRSIGCIAFFLLARMVFGFGVWAGLLGAAVFTVAGNAALQATHAQLFTVAFAPALACLLFQAHRQWSGGNPAKATGWGVGAALFFDAWLLTAFYTAWFTAFWFVLFGAAGLAVKLRQIPSWRRPPLWPLAVTAIAGLVGLVPFLIVYITKIHEVGVHSLSEVRVYTPRLVDLLNPRLVGGAMAPVHDWLAGFYKPRTLYPTGFAPLLLVLAIIGGWASLFAARPPRQTLWFATAAASLASIVLVTHPDGWALVFHLVPGARGLRDVGRFLLVLSVPMILLALLALDMLRRLLPGRTGLALLAVLGLGLLVEERCDTLPVGLDRIAWLQFLRATPRPPVSCKAFFVTGRSPEFASGDPISLLYYRHNVDAMLISALDGLPTINGFSTFNPPDWAFAAVDAQDYPIRVGTYVFAHRLQTGLCALDLSRKRWDAQPELALPRLALGQTIRFDAGPEPALRYLLTGWSGPVPGGRLAMRPRATFALLLPPTLQTRPLVIRMLVAAPGSSQRVIIRVGDREVAQFTAHGLPQWQSVPVPGGTLRPDGGLDLSVNQGQHKRRSAAWLLLQAIRIDRP